jgi:hypothetical protein
VLKEGLMRARRLRGIVAGVFILFLGMVYFAYAAPKDETEAVLQSAESFFKAMKQRNYLVVWKLLSNKSMTAIVEETAKRAASRNHSAVQKGGTARPPQDVQGRQPVESRLDRDVRDGAMRQAAVVIQHEKSHLI